MSTRKPSKFDPLDLYVAAVIAIGVVCGTVLFVTGAGDLHNLLTAEVAVFAVCALIGEFVPIKVFTRGAEGEVTTSTSFAVAAMLVGGPVVGFVAQAIANLVTDGIRRKPPKKVAFTSPSTPSPPP